MDILKFLDRIENLCKQKGLKRQVVYTNCGVGKNFGISIRNGSEPSIGKVYALASELDCSVDYLLGRTDNPAAHIKSSEVNSELITMLSQLTPEQQELVSAQIRGILQSKKSPSPKDNGEK